VKRLSFPVDGEERGGRSAWEEKEEGRGGQKSIGGTSNFIKKSYHTEEGPIKESFLFSVGEEER